jgi:hypothetical protein
MTIFVALMKEDIVKLWRKVKFELEKKTDYFEEILGEDSKTKKAKQYVINLNIINAGSINAINCFILFKKISVEHNGPTKSLPISNTEIRWKNEDFHDIITPYSNKIFTAFVLNAGQTTENKDDIGSPYIQIGDNIFNNETCIGKIKIEYQVICDNIPPHIITLDITWDGSWENRLVDISGNLRANCHMTSWRKT